MQRSLALSLSFLLLASPLVAQDPQPQPFELTVQSIMRGPELYGREPEQVRFTADGEWIYFRWLEPGAAWNAPMKSFRVAAEAGATPEEVSEAHMDTVAPLLARGPKSRDGRWRAVSANGDIWLHQLGARGRVTLRRLTQTIGNESNPRFLLGGREIMFTRDGNVYAFEIASGLTRQLTDIRNGDAPKDPEPPKGQRAALAEQQKDLLQFVRDELAQDSLQRARRRAERERGLSTVWVPEAERIGTIEVSPDGKSAIFATFKPATGTKGADVPDYVTTDGYARMIDGRTKVGDNQGTQKVGHVNLATGKVTWLKLTPDDSISGFANIGDWSPDGRHALVAVTSTDNEDRYIYAVSSADGSTTTVDALHDEAWVNGPCFNCNGWTPDGRAWFVSEASGYAHLYAANPDGSDKEALTSGEWEVLSVDISEDGRWFELTTSEPSPFTRQGYRMPIGGGARTRITSGDGGHEVTYAPDGRTYATVYSTANRPPELFLARVGSDEMSRLTTSPTAEFFSYDWKVPPIITIPGEDGTPVPARIYRPEDHGAQPNGAGVLFVHGAGYLHNVHNWWSSYSREYMFNHLLASKGYTVLDIDYRGSAGYGRDWRTAIYRWMGGKDLDDQVSGSKYLTSEFGIEPERIGLYGGSYGGFITLMALFNKGEYFGAGAALRSVTDWAHYNHGYTGRILNLPQEDKESYRRSSPIFFAEGLDNDPLLIAHGMVDTNVQFQDVVQLAQRLIELGKTGWEMAVYPVESHGFLRPTSWTDEYRRILELFDTTIGPDGSKATP